MGEEKFKKDNNNNNNMAIRNEVLMISILKNEQEKGVQLMGWMGKNLKMIVADISIKGATVYTMESNSGIIVYRGLDILFVNVDQNLINTVQVQYEKIVGRKITTFITSTIK